MKYKRTIQDVSDDLVRMSKGDKKIEGYLEGARRLCREKGMPYYEVFGSAFFNGNIKYLVKNEADGSMLILDLDTGEEWRV